jgi:hypothetical protein
MICIKMIIKLQHLLIKCSCPLICFYMPPSGELAPSGSSASPLSISISVGISGPILELITKYYTAKFLDSALSLLISLLQSHCDDSTNTTSLLICTLLETGSYILKALVPLSYPTNTILVPRSSSLVKCGLVFFTYPM